MLLRVEEILHKYLYSDSLRFPEHRELSHMARIINILDHPFKLFLSEGLDYIICKIYDAGRAKGRHTSYCEYQSYIAVFSEEILLQKIPEEFGI